MSLFSPLLAATAALLKQRRCPMQGLRAESQLVYPNLLLLVEVAAGLSK
jgi:hypothetical protein